ncbi:MAG TPA: hypothetical protein DCY07_06700 [Rhodospirillaceae bacterium]|nr:hypothetical protein [Rhodospirillaceae bacterium]
MSKHLRNRPPSQEMMLMDLIQRLDRLRVGRIALHIHFSKLSNAYKRDSYIQIATESFTILASGFEGQLFYLSNRDLFFVVKGATTTMLEVAVERIRLLFTQDPLLETRDAKGGNGFCTWYEVETEYDELDEHVRKILREADAARMKQEAENDAAPTLARTPLRPNALERLEGLLENVDVTNIARRQTVCTIIDKADPQPLFEEIFISIEDLQNVVTPGVDLASNTWLFRYLTQTLDRRIMLMLIRDGVSSARPFSLNLNVATILSPEFAKFEAIITPQLRGRLVIEMNKLDVFSDMGAFLFARDYLHDHGFRLCLDGLTHHTLPYYDRGKMGFDLMKLYWTPNALDDMLPSMIPEIRNMIMDTGQAHTILCRCDDERAVNTGQELGIVMFQGRHVDRALAAARIAVPSRF